MDRKYWELQDAIYNCAYKYMNPKELQDYAQTQLNDYFFFNEAISEEEVNRFIKKYGSEVIDE